MSGYDRRLNWNTRQRLLSDDMNNSVNLLETKGTDEICAAMSGDLFRSGTPVSGIMSGGKIRTNGSLDVFISPMIGWKYGTPQTQYDSAYLKVETATEITLPLGGEVDGAADRWICIEVSPGETAEVDEQRDIFNPTLGTYIPQNVTVVYRPAPTITINGGVPSGTPVLPQGTPGVIPLAYIYLAAGTSSITDDDVVMCRPLFNVALFEALIQNGKGGLDVENVGTTLVRPVIFGFKFTLSGAQTTVTPRECDCSLPNFPNWAAGESFLTTTEYAPIYAYAALPPYPSGYDDDVSVNRELVTTQAFSRIPSMVNNPVLNGLIVWSKTGPSVSVDNPIGPRPGGDFSLNDPTWGDGQVGFNSYVGCVSNWGTAVAPGLALQKTTSGTVEILEADKTPSDTSTLNGGAIPSANGVFINTSPFLLNNDGKGINTVLPPANDYRALLVDDNIGASTAYIANIIPFGGNDGEGWTMRSDAVVSKYQTSKFSGTIGGGFNWGHEEVSGNNNSFVIRTVGYTDPILGSR